MIKFLKWLFHRHKWEKCRATLFNAPPEIKAWFKHFEQSVVLDRRECATCGRRQVMRFYWLRGGVCDPRELTCGFEDARSWEEWASEEPWSKDRVCD